MRSLTASLALLALVACDDDFVSGRPAPAARRAAPAIVETSVAAAGSDVTGKVTYKGDKIKAKKLNMESDAYCQSAHPDKVMSDEVVIGDDGAVRWALVWVKTDLKTEAPKEAAKLDQKGCQYDPHVFGVVAGQPLKVTNSDGTTHNVHFVPKMNTLSPDNKTQKQNMEDSWTLSTPEAPFFIKCDIHPWMGAWCGVFQNSYFAVTGADGSFSIKGLPKGKYSIEVWHEKLEGAKGVEVEVDGTAAGSANFEFSGKKK